MLSKDQAALLQRIAAGGKIWRGHVQRTGAEMWNIQTAPGQNDLVPALTARALARAKLIEPSGLLYWRITEDGRRAINWKEEDPAPTQPT